MVLVAVFGGRLVAERGRKAKMDREDWERKGSRRVCRGVHGANIGAARRLVRCRRLWWDVRTTVEPLVFYMYDDERPTSDGRQMVRGGQGWIG